LQRIEFNRRFTTEHADHDFDTSAFVVNVTDFTFKVLEWTIDDANDLVSCQLTEQQEVEVGLKFNGTSFNV
jgi:hypothetical protein